MIIGAIKNGIVLDHITAGRAMEIYDVLHLGELECTVAIIKNADSAKKGKKDILKIFEVIDLDLDVLGYIDSGITVNIIQEGQIVSRKHLALPDKVVNVIKCQNPRCITSTEQGIDQVFKLTNRANGVYRCMYCESKAKQK